jgi:hypothetical protein
MQERGGHAAALYPNGRESEGKRQEGSSSFFEKKEPKKLFSLWSRRISMCEPQRQHRGAKSFFASFCSQKEDSCLPATCLCDEREADLP